MALADPLDSSAGQRVHRHHRRDPDPQGHRGQRPQGRGRQNRAQAADQRRQVCRTPAHWPPEGRRDHHHSRPHGQQDGHRLAQDGGPGRRGRGEEDGVGRPARLRWGNDQDLRVRQLLGAQRRGQRAQGRRGGAGDGEVRGLLRRSGRELMHRSHAGVLDPQRRPCGQWSCSVRPGAGATEFDFELPRVRRRRRCRPPARHGAPVHGARRAAAPLRRAGPGERRVRHVAPGPRHSAAFRLWDPSARLC